ncbi:MAG: hypothetical protein ACTSRZ_05645 [Promethearchaeota archaeon]
MNLINFYLSIIAIAVLFFIWIVLYYNFRFKRWDIVKSNGIERFNIKMPRRLNSFPKIIKYTHKFMENLEEKYIIYTYSEKKAFYLMEQFCVGSLLAQIPNYLIYLNNFSESLAKSVTPNKLFEREIKLNNNSAENILTIIHYGKINHEFIEFLKWLENNNSNKDLKNNLKYCFKKLILLNPDLKIKTKDDLNFLNKISESKIMQNIATYMIYSRKYKSEKKAENPLNSLIKIFKIPHENIVELKLGNKLFKFEETVVFGKIMDWVYEN